MSNLLEQAQARLDRHIEAENRRKAEGARRLKEALVAALGGAKADYDDIQVTTVSNPGYNASLSYEVTGTLDGVEFRYRSHPGSTSTLEFYNFDGQHWTDINYHDGVRALVKYLNSDVPDA